MNFAPILFTALLVRGISAIGITAGSQVEPRQNLISTGYTGCDALIAAGLADRVFLPTDTEYSSSLGSYYASNVQELHPWCIVKPETTYEVSKALSALVKTSPAGNWDIAVRGGGHSHFASNNVVQGITIDLSRMNATTYRNGSSIASIQPGARWASVFAEVEKYGQTVTGGRAGSVGVSGLTLGGGASFHTGNRGFACDDVKNYEVVLADGSIINANADEHPDLFKALKGGSNNFGIVTRFDMVSFKAAPGGIWGGLLFLSYDHKQTVMEQFVRLIDINHDHPDDTEVVTFTYSGEGPILIAINAVNTAGISNSTSFAPIQGLPSILNALKRRSYGNLITEYESEGGKRNVWFSLCFHNDMDMMNKVAELFEGLVAELQTLIPAPDLDLTSVSQPLPKHFADKSHGNVLGLDTSLTHNSIVWLGQAQVRTAEQEALANVKLAAMTAELEAYAEANGKATAWRYLNYVNPAQDPISTYGEDNVRFLKEVAAKYDPLEVFQTRIPGGFKISKVVV